MSLIKRLLDVIERLHLFALIIFAAIGGFGAIYVHYVTIITALDRSGWLMCIAAFMLPMISEIYWFIKIGTAEGFNAIYCQTIIVYTSILIVIFIFILIYSTIQSFEKSN